MMAELLPLASLLGWSLACYSAYRLGKSKGALDELRNGSHIETAFTTGLKKGYLLCLSHDDVARREHLALFNRMRSQ